MAVDWDKMPAPKGGPVPLPLDAPKRVKHSLSPGDHIYCNRDKAADLYSHHGIYVGDGKVIHFASDSSQAGYPRKDSIDSRFIRIMRGTLSGFKGSDTLEIVEYNSEMSVKERVELETGSCHRVDAMPRDETLKVAEYFVERSDLWDSYNLYSNNCENFACFCKTGLLDIASQLHPESAILEIIETPCTSADEAIKIYLKNRRKNSLQFPFPIPPFPFPNPPIPVPADPFPNPLIPVPADPFPNPPIPVPADPFPNPLIPVPVDPFPNPLIPVPVDPFPKPTAHDPLTALGGAVRTVVGDPEAMGRVAAALATVAFGPVGQVLAKVFDWNIFGR